MGTKKRILFVFLIWLLITMVGAFAWRMYPSQPPPEGAAVVRAFSASGAQFKRLEVNGWAVVDQTQGPAYVTPAPKTSARWEIQPGIFAKLTLQTAGSKTGREDGAEAKQNAYLIMSVTTEEPSYSYDDLGRIMQDFMKGQEYHRNTIISGYFKGQKSPSEVDDIISRMLREAEAEIVNTMANDRLVSVSAFTPEVHNRLTLGSQSVNINMAVRYNAVEDVTMVYVGSPIINSEY